MTTPDALDPDRRPVVVVAGPSSTLTVPGVVASQIVGALSAVRHVVRIEVNAGEDFDSGLYRVPFLAAAHDWGRLLEIDSRQAPDSPRLRARAFREWLTEDTSLAVAFIWPGLDTLWVRKYFETARSVGARTVAVIASVPRSSQVNLAALAAGLAMADLVLVGDQATRDSLGTILGPRGPRVGVNSSLCLRGRAASSGVERITAFLPRDDQRSLAVLLTAFDAVPEAWAPRYRLHVVMRVDHMGVPRLIAEAHHADCVRLTSSTLSDDELRAVCAESSALIVADPAIDSRVFSVAVECGVATVVLTSDEVPAVGSGYVGGLLADQELPVSVHVALHHALRLAGLSFPPPSAWSELVASILEVEGASEASPRGLAVASSSG